MTNSKLMREHLRPKTVCISTRCVYEKNSHYNTFSKTDEFEEKASGKVCGRNWMQIPLELYCKDPAQPHTSQASVYLSVAQHEKLLLSHSKLPFMDICKSV